MLSIGMGVVALGVVSSIEVSLSSVIAVADVLLLMPEYCMAYIPSPSKLVIEIRRSTELVLSVLKKRRRSSVVEL